MDLPVMPPVSPMLAKPSKTMPTGDFLYEPKWDGFRCIVFRDGDEVVLGSRNGKALERYFPEMLEPLRRSLPDRVVLDGELVIMTDHGLDFDVLSARIHPAASRVAKLAAETPSSFVAFDLLALGSDDLRKTPCATRRGRLVDVLADAAGPVHCTPATLDSGVADAWFEHFEGAGLDGVMAKPLDGVYLEGQRTMLKVKHQRTCDAVVAGFRWHKDGEGVGSLLLGLFDDSGALHHVGVASSFSAATRLRLLAEIADARSDALVDHPWAAWAEFRTVAAADDAPQRLPGALSRWNANKDLSWEPLRIGLVAEVNYEHLQGDRFRHTARFARWRPDRDPSSCTYAQLDVPVPFELLEIFG